MSGVPGPLAEVLLCAWAALAATGLLLLVVEFVWHRVRR